MTSASAQAALDLGDDVLRALVVEDRVDRVEAQAVDVEVVDPAASRSAAPTRARRACVKSIASPQNVSWRSVKYGPNARRPGRPRRRRGCRRRRGSPRARGRARRRRGAPARAARRRRGAPRSGRRRRSPSRAAPGTSATGISSMAVTPSSARRRGRDGAVEGPLGGERADVQLVETRSASAGARAALVGPGEGRGSSTRDGPAHALGLPAGARVGPRRPVEDEPVVVARGGLGDHALPARPRPASSSGMVAAADAHGDALGARGAQARNSTPPRDHPGAERRCGGGAGGDHVRRMSDSPALSGLAP